MALTELEVRRAKAGETIRRLPDDKGLYLRITPGGGKLWRWDYRFNGWIERWHWAGTRKFR